jgi:hypothetical protein
VASFVVQVNLFYVLVSLTFIAGWIACALFSASHDCES